MRDKYFKQKLSTLSLLLFFQHIYKNKKIIIILKKFKYDIKL